MRKRQIAHFLSQCERKKRMETFTAIIFAGGFLAGAGTVIGFSALFIWLFK